MKVLKRRLFGKNIAVDVRIVQEKPAKVSILKRAINFVTDVVVAAKNTVVDFFVGLYHNAESTIILILSSIGLSALLAEIPFWFTVPFWFEAFLVIPFISVCIILLLLYIAERRGYYRLNRAVA